MNTTTNLPIAPSQQMALRISGTKQRQAGFVPLVSVGVLAGNEGANMDRATTVAEKPVYVIKHASDYILYQVIDRGVKSFDADAPGVLSIALTIPRQFQLSDAQSPYTLLREVYETFVSEFMRPSNDGRDCFLNTDVDSDVFRSILQNYSLEARKTGYVTMNPAGLTATLRLSEDKIVDFFRDSQYGELAQFKDIEIGGKCQSFPGLDHLEIPRPVKYDVYVNDAFTRTSLSKQTNSYSTQVKDTDYYTYENVSFTLEQLFAAPDGCIVTGNSKVQLDQARCRIDCTIGKQEIMYNCVIKVSSPNNAAAQIEIEEALKSKKIKVLIDRVDITSYGDYNDLQIPATKILSRQPSLSTIKYEDYLLSLAVTSDMVQHKKTLTITAKQQHKPGTLSPNGHNDNSVGGLSTISSGWNPSENHGLGEIQIPSEEERIAKEKERERRKRERRKALLVVFAVGLLVGYLIGHYIVPNHQTKEEPANPPIEDAEGRSVDDGNEETQREERVNKWLKSSIVVKALKGYGKDAESIEELVNKALADKPNEEDEAMLNDVLNFESSQLLVENYMNEVGAEEGEAIQLQEQQREIESAEAIAKAQARKEILELVNKRDLSGCRKHSGWNEYLTEKERGAVEAVLDMTKYKGTVRKNVENFLQGKKFSSYEEITENQKEIWKIIKEEN